MDINKKRIDETLDKAFQKNQVPAIAAAVLSSDQTLYRGNFGYSDFNLKTPLKDDAIFRIASMTKAVTSVCIFQLIEQDQLKLDSKLKEFFPEIGDLKIIDGFDNNDNPVYSKPSTDITIAHLLTHTSGFSYEMWNENISKLIAKGELATLFSANSDFLKAPLVFNPGSNWDYGIGIDWLGVLIEKLSDLSLQEYMQKNVFEPLEMADTSYDTTQEIRDRMVKVYSRNGDGYLELPFEGPKKSAFYSGGGNLNSTISDYSKFLQLFLSGPSVKEKVLSQESIDMMISNQTGTLFMQTMKTTSTAISNDVNFFPETEKPWGFGFMINASDVVNGRPAKSAGWAGLFNSFFWLDKKNNLAGLIMMQMLPFLEDGAQKTLRDFEQSVYEA